MKHLLILFLILSSLFTSAAAKPVAANSTCGSTYTVQRGDHLAKIARLCSVTVSDLLAANPNIKNRNLIYPGQVIKIPSSSQPDPGMGGVVYMVKPGDTLNEIARLFKVTLQDILKTNPSITNPNRIESGIQIKLPEGAARIRTAGIDPRSGKAGDKITLAVTGFAANTDLEIRFGPSATDNAVIGTLKTDAKGAILQTVTIPTTAQAGKSYVFIVQVKSDPAVNAVSNPFKVDGTSDPATKVYTVQRGDTLRKIANRFNTTVAALVAANPDIKNPNLISVGQRINLPGGGRGAAVSTIPGDPLPGSKIRVIVDGFPAHQNIDIRLGVDINNPTLVIDARTDVSGYLNQEISIPASAKSGETWNIRVLTTEMVKVTEAATRIKIK
ncbi:MAG: LysM peptidoglycan-binding domain-containing protein [Chloroflexota bacterium]